MSAPEKILAIAKEMREQDNRSTAHPLFMVYRPFEEVRPSGIGERRRKSGDYIEEGQLCASCEVLQDQGEMLTIDCDACDEECFYYAEDVMRTDDEHGVFFTAKACDEYIEARRYAVGQRAVSYAISAYHSNEMREVIEYLKSL
jgi:hypothetical protein